MKTIGVIGDGKNRVVTIAEPVGWSSGIVPILQNPTSTVGSTSR